MHRTEIVLVMGRKLTMGVSSTKLDRQQQNFSGHILLYWSVVLQGRPARQNVSSTPIWALLTGPADWVCHIGTLTLCVEAVA